MFDEQENMTKFISEKFKIFPSISFLWRWMSLIPRNRSYSSAEVVRDLDRLVHSYLDPIYHHIILSEEWIHMNKSFQARWSTERKRNSSDYFRYLLQIVISSEIYLLSVMNRWEIFEFWYRIWKISHIATETGEFEMTKLVWIQFIYYL